jgi:hypothetical protein
MGLETCHIEFLQLVAKNEVRLWYAPGGKTINYVHTVWGETHQSLDQKVAAQAKALGLTKVTHIAGDTRSTHARPTVVVLSDRGARVLEDEEKAWE